MKTEKGANEAMSIASTVLRLAFLRSDTKRDKGLATPDGIRRFDDIRYGPDEAWHVLDVYRPRDAKDPLPVIVSVHGGGWVYGDKERYQYYCMHLAEHGFGVVNFTYRLAPRHKFPAPLEDTNRVFSWVLEHGAAYGLDTGRVFAVGDSAGAQILGLYCCICTNPGYAAAYRFSPPAGFAPRAVALNCGVYQVRPGRKKDLTAWLLRDYLPGKGTEEEIRRVSVLEHLTPAFPPAFVMTCQGDFLAWQAPPLADKLQALGVPTVYRFYGDPEHVLGHVFHCNVRSADAARCNDDECAYFSTFLA